MGGVNKNQGSPQQAPPILLAPLVRACVLEISLLFLTKLAPAMHASQIVDDQSLKSPCVDVRATHLIVIHLLVAQSGKAFSARALATSSKVKGRLQMM